jgi:hypothetical protein
MTRCKFYSTVYKTGQRPRFPYKQNTLARKIHSDVAQGLSANVFVQNVLRLFKGSGDMENVPKQELRITVKCFV